MSNVIIPRRTGAVLLIILVVASTIVYYNIALSSESARIEDLQRVVAELENKNSLLERRLSLLERPQGNTSLFGLDSVRIYADSNRSIVTIAGAEITVVDTIFGQRKGIVKVIGSGFVIQYLSTYYIVTNFHVIDGLVNVTVTFWDGDTYRAEVVGSDAYVDLAVVSAEASAEEFYPLQLSSSSTINVGDPVVAIGNPFGLSGSVTFGIVSQLGRTMQYESPEGTFPMADVIQFTAPINPGNSGGPLLNTDGCRHHNSR